MGFDGREVVHPIAADLGRTATRRKLIAQVVGLNGHKRFVCQRVDLGLTTKGKTFIVLSWQTTRSH